MPNYTNPFELQRQKALADLFSQGVEHGSRSAEEQMKAERVQAEQQANIQQALDLKDQLNVGDDKYNIGLGAGGGVNLSQAPKDIMAQLLGGAKLKEQQETHDAKQLQDLEDRSTKAGTSQMVPAMQRAEAVVPGIMQGKGKPISVGGLKTLIPNVVVPVAEKFGMLPEGAAKERAALQELANVKIYDSSGKQINEQEMKRIQDAMGLRGVTDPEVLNDAMKQLGYTVMQKQTQVTAGAQPDAVKTFKKRGGLAGYKSLEELLGGKQAAQSQPQVMSSEQQPDESSKMQRYLELKKKYGR